MRLRIISGKLKGNFINAPKSKLTRPTTDRVRETLFNILNNQISFERVKVLDLYSGSGALGFEAFSRGANEIHFVEKNHSVYTNLDQNIKKLRAENSCKIFRTEASSFTNSNHGFKYDIVFADPPFFEYDIYLVVKNLFKNDFLTEDGFIIIERSIQTKEKDIENFNVEPFKIVGDACLYKISQ
jgi:16S rRNA (guanine966-N2)-methyltransferase